MSRESARGRILVRRAAKQGEAGANGLTIRVTVWESGKDYRNDQSNPNPADGVRYLDICSDKAIDFTPSSGGTARIYVCKQTHNSSNHPLQQGAYWDEMNTMKPIATALILAETIKAKYLDVDSISTALLSATSAFIDNLAASDLATKRAFISRLIVKALQTDSGKVKIENNGSITAQDAVITGILNATKGILQDVTIKGSLSSPPVMHMDKYITCSYYGSDYKFVRYPAGDYASYGSYCWRAYYNPSSYVTYNTIYLPAETPTVGMQCYASYNLTSQRGIVTAIIPVNVFNGKEDGSDRHDNVILPQRPAYSSGNPSYSQYLTITPEQFTWGADNIGRTIRLINYKYYEEPDGYITLQAPSGKYFYESGYQRDAIRLSREYVELFGYGAEGVFFGWIVVNRQDVKTRGEYGMPWKVIYQGCVNPKASVPLERLWSCDLDISGHNENSWGYQRKAEGHYRIYLPKRIEKYDPKNYTYDYKNCWHVILSPRSCDVGGTHITDMIDAGYACLFEKGYTYEQVGGSYMYRSYFEVKTADDASLNELAFDFFVISMANWVTPSING